MRNFTALLIITLLFISCGKPPEERGIYFKKKESLDNIIAFVTDSSGIRVYSLPSFSFLKKVDIKNPESIFVKNDSIFVYNSALFYYDLKSGTLKKVKKIVPNLIALILTEEGIYSITREGLLYNDEVVLTDSIKEFGEDPNNIWLLTSKSLIAVRKKTNEKRIKQLEKPLTFCVSPYGLRIYVAYENRIEIYEGKDFSFVKSIPLDTPPHMLVSTPAGNKIYAVSKNLYVVDRTSCSIKKELPLPATPLNFYLARDGSYGIVVLGDRLLILDAGRDIIVKELWISQTVDINTSPLSSRIYAMTDEGIAIIRSDSLSIEKFVDIRGSKIFIPGAILKEEPPQKKVEQRTAYLFTIQASSGKSKKNAEELVHRLVMSGYPAYIVSGDGWFRVRVGAFKEKRDALIIANKVNELIKENSWVLETHINLAEIPRILARDLNKNGYMEESAREDGDIVILELKDGIYTRIHTIPGFLRKYSANPSFEDFDGDGTLEIVTPTPNPGIYSVVEYKDGKWVEGMVRRK